MAFEVRTAAPSDFITSAGHRGGYILSARDLITNDIEVAVEGALLDGMLCLASCDKTAPGQLMAAARLNIPSVIVACGYQPSGTYRGRHCDIEDVFLAAGHVANGKLTVAELTEMSEHAVLGPGVCAGMGTANTMHLACEALGMALPGTTPVRANSEPMWRAVEQAARRVVEMTAEDLRPRDILTPGAFANAVTAVLSVSGSINSVKHLQAVAAEAECGADVYRLFEDLAGRVPLLAAVRPNGAVPIEAFEDAGGARAVMKQLEPLLDAGLVRRRGGVEIFGRPAPSGDVRWAARHGLTLVPERRQLYPNCPRRTTSCSAVTAGRPASGRPVTHDRSASPLNCSRRSDRTWGSRPAPCPAASSRWSRSCAGWPATRRSSPWTNPAWAWPSRSAGGCTTRWPGSTRPGPTLVVVEEAPKRALVICDRRVEVRNGAVHGTGAR